MEKLMVATITGNLDKGQREVLKADMEAQLGPGYRVLLVPQGVAVSAAHWPATVSEPGKAKPLPEITPQPRTEGEMPISEPRTVGKMAANVTPFKDALARVKAVLEEEIADAARKSVQVGHLVVKLDKSEVMEAIAQARARVEEEIAKAKTDRVNRAVLLMLEHATYKQCDKGYGRRGRMVVIPYGDLTAKQRACMPRVWCEMDDLDA